jgi:hypothetical protein
MTDAELDILSIKIQKYHDALDAYNWTRIESAMRSAFRSGITSYINPLDDAETPIDARNGSLNGGYNPPLTMAMQVRRCRHINPAVIGGVFYDNSSYEHFKDTGILRLTVGDFDPDPALTPAEHDAASLSITKKVIKLLKRRDLHVEWDGTAQGKIDVDMTCHNKKFVYSEMDDDLEEYLLDGDLVVEGRKPH